jgi:Holliday junction resolvase
LINLRGLKMGISNYYKGRNREYYAMRLLKKKGWICIRSAASHSPADILAAKNGVVKLIQVKSGKINLKEKKELKRWAKAFNAKAEVWHFKNGRIIKETIK